MDEWIDVCTYVYVRIYGWMDGWCYHFLLKIHGIMVSIIMEKLG
jgi:hypothetical protein